MLKLFILLALQLALSLASYGFNPDEDFIPSQVEQSRMSSLFKSLTKGLKKNGRGVCFSRAHLWADEMKRDFGIQSQKLWLFFGPRYRQMYNYSWWFHVAPIVLDQKGEEWVMDRSFTRKPKRVQDWLNEFVFLTPGACLEVKNYKDYKAAIKDEMCVLMRTPMYYYYPTDIEKRDFEGVYKTELSLEDLANARKRAR